VPLAQGAIDFALSGVTSLAEAMAVGSGLEELVEMNAPREFATDMPLEDSGVDTLLEHGA
jgi:hypothetical protein